MQIRGNRLIKKKICTSISPKSNSEKIDALQGIGILTPLKTGAPDNYGRALACG
jgi:hypothetical protein